MPNSSSSIPQASPLSTPYKSLFGCEGWTQHIVPRRRSHSNTDAGQPQAERRPTFTLPDVPNEWGEMYSSAGEAVPAATEVVEYMDADDEDGAANDAMLLIMLAVQARSQGRSLTGDRRATAEQYWRRLEENQEAGLFQDFRSSTDSGEIDRI